jgi:uncharacterized GH25 family protein
MTLRTPGTGRLVFTVMCLLAAALPAAAHDFWIEPAEFRPAVGESVPVVLRVGEDFSGTSQPYVADWFVDFSVGGADGRTPVKGFAGDDPATVLVARAPGLQLIGYYSQRSFVDLEAGRFNAYLEAEGLDTVIKARQRRGESATNGRELYSRCAKSLVRVGAAAGSAGFDQVLGYPLELVPRTDPYALSLPGTLRLALTFSGKPVAGVLVVAFTAEQPQQRLRARTDARGEVRLRLDRPGRWLVKAVHMVELPDTDPQADWESYWASLTFGL